MLYNPIRGADNNSVITNMATVRMLETGLILDRGDARARGPHSSKPKFERCSLKQNKITIVILRDLRDYESM